MIHEHRHICKGPSRSRWDIKNIANLSLVLSLSSILDLSNFHQELALSGPCSRAHYEGGKTRLMTA